jgi:hypothetical protein
MDVDEISCFECKHRNCQENLMFVYMSLCKHLNFAWSLELPYRFSEMKVDYTKIVELIKLYNSYLKYFLYNEYLIKYKNNFWLYAVWPV